MQCYGFQNLRFRRGRTVQTQEHNVKRNSRTSNCRCSMFKKKKTSIIRNFCKSRWLAVPNNPDMWSSTVFDLPCSYWSPLATAVSTVCKFVSHQRYRCVISWRMTLLHGLSLLMAFRLLVAAVKCCSEAQGCVNFRLERTHNLQPVQEAPYQSELQMMKIQFVPHREQCASIIKTNL